MNSTGLVTGGVRPPFTLSQWQELEHQALIFKYLMAGVPVPPELLLPIRRSFEAMATRFYQTHPTMSYCSFYGKKLDPEPGRCRRTDGKKWRCSKEAYPGSKYCERHMHRGRNRSRKPVETHTISQTPHSSPSPSPASSVTSLALMDRGRGYGGRNTGGSGGDGIALHAIANAQNQGSCSGTNSQQLHLDHPASYSGIGSKDYRHIEGLKLGIEEHSYFSGASKSERQIGVESSLDNAWNLMPSVPSPYSLSKYGNGLDLSRGGYAQLQPLHDIKHESVTPLTSQQQHYYDGQFGSDASPKEESQSIRPFLDQWPRARDSWYDFEKERPQHSSYSTTHLSISIPMASSDFSTTSSRSANEE